VEPSCLSACTGRAVTAAQAAPVSVANSSLIPTASAASRWRQRDDERFREHVTRTGTRYYTFYFGDGTQTIYVVSYEKPQCQAGAATVEGTFEQ